MKTNKQKLLIIVALLTLPACSDSGFSGKTGKSTVSPEAAKGDDPNALGDGKDGDQNADKTGSKGSGGPGGGANDSPCDAAYGKTQARLLTSTVANGKQGNFIEYELSLTDCDDKVRSFNANTVLFDMLALTSLSGSKKSLPFTISANGEKITGQLREVQGEDLFGNTGPQYFHHRSDETIKFTTQVNSVRLKIQLLGLSATSIDSQTSGPGFSSQPVTLPTYLGFGKAAVVRKDVRFE
jgi:hypothetical protein